MKLLELRIENFGGLQGRRISLNDGLNIVVEANGFGKTTLAEFILAMFYGFPPRSKSLNKDKRRSYLPWQGGTYGGAVIFEHKGRTYRLERTFGFTPSGDTFTLYNEATQAVSSDFDSSIGETIFGLDCSSFARTIYFSQISGKNDSAPITSRLTALLEASDDAAGYETALKLLADARRRLMPRQGNSGEYGRLRERLISLNESIDKAESDRIRLIELREKISCDRERLKDLRGEFNRLEEAMRRNEAQRTSISARKVRDELRVELDDVRGKIKRIDARYPNGLPSERDVFLALKTCEEVSFSSLTEEESRSLPQAIVRLREKEAVFAAGEPSEEEREGMRQDIVTLTGLERELEDCHLSIEEERELKALKGFFREVPNRKGLERLSSIDKEIQALKISMDMFSLSEGENKRLRKLEAFFSQGNPESAIKEARGTQRVLEKLDELPVSVQGGGKRSYAAAAACAVGLLMIACGLCLNNGLKASFVVAILMAGILLLGWGVFRLYRVGRLSEIQRAREKSRLEKAIRVSLNPWFPDSVNVYDDLDLLEGRWKDYSALIDRETMFDIRRREAFSHMNRLEEERLALLSPWFGEEIPPDAEDILRRRIGRYAALDRARNDVVAHRKALNERIDEITEELKEFFRPYFGDVSREDFSSALDHLDRLSYRGDSDRNLLERAESSQLAKEKYQMAFKKLGDIVGKSFQGTEREISSMLSDITERASLIKQEQEIYKRLEEFSSKNAELLDETIGDISQSLADPGKRALEITEEDIPMLEMSLVSAEHEISMIAPSADNLPVLEDEREALYMELERVKADASLLDETASCISRAKESLSSRYLEPIRVAFTSYLNRITNEDPEGVHIDSDLSVSLERDGITREMAYFSSGEEEAVAICMRFALVDAVFGDNRPFLVLDDPFVNLDDQRVERALAVLHKISEGGQVIYLTCSKSRA